MARLVLTPRAYARITFGALLALAAIVVTGGAVRVTGSGLGCPNWPTCDQGRIVAPAEYHAMVEFLNRTVTGAVSVLVILAVLGSLLRVPRRPDLVWLSLGLVAGVIGQIVLGGLVVLYHLWPPLVMGHFVLSMILLLDAAVLHHRAAEPEPEDSEVRPAVTADQLVLGRLLVAAAALVILLGTVVTGSGPHAGSHDGQLVERLPFELRDVARLHGLAVWLFLALAAYLAWSLRRTGAAPAVARRATTVLAVIVGQAAVGYTQYFTGVPAALVAIHIAGSVAVWLTTLRLLFAMQVRTPSRVAVAA